MRKLLLLLMFSIVLIGVVSSQSSLESIGTYQQGKNIEIVQTCDDCSYVTLEKIQLANKTILTINENMTKVGTVYNYTLDSNYTESLGEYIVFGSGDTTPSIFNFAFTITPSGQSGNENTVFFILIILIVYGITFTGFFGKNIPITILGGMAMIFLGVYLIRNGVIIYRDNLTNYLAYLTSGIGTIMSLWAGYEWYQDM